MAKNLPLNSARLDYLLADYLFDFLLTLGNVVQKTAKQWGMMVMWVRSWLLDTTIEVPPSAALICCVISKTLNSH